MFPTFCCRVFRSGFCNSRNAFLPLFQPSPLSLFSSLLKHPCRPLIVHFFELSPANENKRRGREGEMTRGADCVKGGFCLINCFSGCRLSARFLDGRSAALWSLWRAVASLFPPSPPSPVHPPSLSRPLCHSSTLPSLHEFAHSAAGADCAPAGRRSWQIQQLPLHARYQLPGRPERFMEHTVKAFHEGTKGGDSKQPARHTWVKLHSDYPLISNIIKLEVSTVVC